MTDLIPTDNRTQQIDRNVDQLVDAFFEETARLCAQPSVSTTQTGVAECAKMVMSIFEKYGIDAQEISTSGYPMIVGKIAGKSDRTLLFYNHYDVQPPDPLDEWISPPFTPTFRDGSLYARGAADDKGEFISRIAAVQAVRQAHGGELPCGVTFVVEGEEEMGSPHIAKFVKDNLDLLQCDGAIWEVGEINPEGRPIIYLGYRGILDLELSVTTMSREAHSGFAHMLPSAAWRLIWALEALKGPDEIIKIPGFLSEAKPPTPDDLRLFELMPDEEQWARDTFGAQEFPSKRSGKELSQAVFEPTCNIQGITTGYQGEGGKTVIPPHAVAKLDFRLVPDQDPIDIFEKTRRFLSESGFSDVEVSLGEKMWPAKTDGSNPLIELTASTGMEVYGKPSIIYPLVGGSSPVYAFAKPLNIPFSNAGIRYWDNRVHAPNEHIRKIDFHNGIKHLARIVDRFADIS